MLISASTTRSAPSAAPAAPATTADAIRSLITGGTPRVYLTSTSAPVAATTSRISWVIRSGASRQASRLRIRTVPRDLTVARDRVERLARVHRAPDHRDAGARIDPAVQQRGHVDDHPAQGVHQVGGQVRAGGVAARAGEGDLDRVGGRGERAGAHADQAGRQLRVAVQRVDRGDVLERTGRDHLGRAGRHALLGRLEDQPDPAGQLALLGPAGPGPGRGRAARWCARRGRRRARRSARWTGTARPWCPATAARPGRRGRRSPGRPRRCRRSRRCPWAAAPARGRRRPARGRSGRPSRTPSGTAPGGRECDGEWLPALPHGRPASGRAGRARDRRRAAGPGRLNCRTTAACFYPPASSGRWSRRIHCHFRERNSRLSATRDSLVRYW